MNEITEWVCSSCTNSFRTKDGGLCGSCLLPFCRSHLKQKENQWVCVDCADIINKISIKSHEIQISLDENGFAIIEPAVPLSLINRLKQRLFSISETSKVRTRSTHGLRNLTALDPLFRALMMSTTIQALIKPCLGQSPFLVQSLFLDKPSDANWSAPWHQDLTIPVREQKFISRFQNWRQKNETWFVQPPSEILEQMLIVRLHLDDTNKENGALKVIRGSHKMGKVSGRPLKQVQEGEEVVCQISAGGILLFRPLLLHASLKSTVSIGRKVIHLQFSSKPLPDPLQYLGE
jgi:hypothetical protein